MVAVTWVVGTQARVPLGLTATPAGVWQTWMVAVMA